VISTVHTKNAVQTLSRLIAVFDPNEQEMIRIRLAESMQAVISQRLVPTKDGMGRVPACEIMRVTGTIRDCIRDKDRLDEIFDLIEEGRSQYGSQSFDQHLMDLVKADQVDFKVAKAAANNPTDFDLKMNTFGGRDSGSAVLEEASTAPGSPSQDLANEMTHIYGS
jgi:twitching motility protein PilT